jgi:hypothetical protein
MMLIKSTIFGHSVAKPPLAIVHMVVSKMNMECGLRNHQPTDLYNRVVCFVGVRIEVLNVI